MVLPCRMALWIAVRGCVDGGAWVRVTEYVCAHVRLRLCADGVCVCDHVLAWSADVMGRCVCVCVRVCALTVCGCACAFVYCKAHDKGHQT